MGPVPEMVRAPSLVMVQVRSSPQVPPYRTAGADPVDPVAPLWKDMHTLLGVPAINWVKWCILKINAVRNKKILQDKGIKSPLFFGIFYTCEMKKDVVETLLPAYEAYAEGKNEELELMFHPGNLTAEYELLDARRKELAAFYMSDNRFYEAECLKQLKWER